MDPRFDRHTLVPGWNQTLLSNAKVVIFGMGALGNEVARLLSMSGVGNLIICDFDTVTVSNLSRCSLFRESDIGKLKVNAAASSLRELAPKIKVDPRPKRLINGVGLAELRDASLVLGCLDSRVARLELAGRCSLVCAPYIDGGTHPWGGEVRLYVNPEGPCYACGLTPEERSVTDAPWSCNDFDPEAFVGSTASSSVLVAAYIASFSLRFLMNLSLPDGGIVIDACKGTSKVLQHKRDPNCLLHTPILSTRKIPVKSADGFGHLQENLGDDLIPLSWYPVQHSVRCFNCGFKETQWGMPSVKSCQQCGSSLVLQTTLDLSNAPSIISLSALGIPSGEILAVRGKKSLEYVELSQI